MNIIHNQSVTYNPNNYHLAGNVANNSTTVQHEATVSKVGEDQLFYLMSRGISENEATAMVVNGFVEPITKEIPLEYAVELNRLIELQMEGSIG
jgi:Fe-S cluster assembly protein SufB